MVAGAADARRKGGAEAAEAVNGGCNASGAGLKGMPGAVHMTIQLAPGGLANSGDDGVHSNALFAGLHFISHWETCAATTSILVSINLINRRDLII